MFSMKNKKLLIISILAILSFVFFLLVVTFKGQIEYYYEMLILGNRSTVLFSCNEFGSEQEMNEIYEMLKERDDPLLSDIEDAGGLLNLAVVGERCPNKFQFEILFPGNYELADIQNLIPGQTIEGKPVFLRNF